MAHERGNSQGFSDDTLFWNLRVYGAPLVRRGMPGTTLSLEETLAGALALSRRHLDVARAWPVVFARNREFVNLAQLVEEAVRLDQPRTLGFLLSVSRELMGDRSLLPYEQSLMATTRGVERFFQRPRAWRVLELEERRTPEVAKKWGFTLNATLESFRTCFEKFEGAYAGV